jgi:hypothetical protein
MNRYRLGWLTDDEVSTDVAGGSYTLYPIAAPGKQRLRVQVGENAFYFIEVQERSWWNNPPLGAPASISRPSAGVYVRLWRNAEVGDNDRRAVPARLS